MNITDALLYSVLGFAVVFVCLIALFLIIKVMSGIYLMAAKRKQPTAVPAVPAAPAAPAAAVPANDGRGTYGDLVLTNTDERSAACIMAIVSDMTQIPLCELRFKSIKLIEK